MGDIFTPLSRTIQDLFDGGSYYNVPSYQRPYSWDSEQVDELWEDIYGAFDNDDEEYFLGSIILTKNGDNKYLDVVDGQQRLTTLMILFCALRDLYFAKHKDSVKRNRIEGRIKNLENGYERLKLFRTQPQHQNTFEQEILNGIDFNRNLTTNELKENKFMNTALKFKEKILPLINDQDDLEQFTEYLLDRVRVISITCSNQGFAIKLFQVLNNRGLDLTAGDLIKSYLMGNLENDEDRRTFEQEWIYIETKAKELSEDLTDLLTYYEYYLLTSNPRRSLYKELEVQFKGKNPLSIIYEFKKLVNLLLDIDKESPKSVYPMYYLRHDVYWKSILLTAMLEEWDHEEIIKLAHLLRKFYYLYWIADYTSSRIKQTSFNVIGWIKQEKDFDFIKDEILKKIKSDKAITKVRDNLEGNIYQSAWCKPLFILLEYEQVESPNMNFIKIDKEIHIEHILPQSFSDIPYWSSKFDDTLGNNLVNTLGNLTLLSGKKNIEASNSPFNEKLEIYKGKGKDGLTNFVLTQKVANEANEEGWNKETIEKRKDFIISEIQRVLEIDFKKDTEEEKKQEKKSAKQPNEVYTIEQHLQGRDQEVITIFNKIVGYVKSLYKEVLINPQKYYISLKSNRNFAFIRIKNSKLKMVIMLPFDKYANKIKSHTVRQLSKGVQKFYNGDCFDVIVGGDSNLEEIFELLKEAIKF